MLKTSEIRRKICSTAGACLIYGFPLRTTRAKAKATTPTTIMLHFPFFLASNLATLHHTRLHHHEQRGKPIEMGENRKRKGTQTSLWRGTTRIDDDVP
jgi:hypothetical protein